MIAWTKPMYRQCDGNISNNFFIVSFSFNIQLGFMFEACFDYFSMGFSFTTINAINFVRIRLGSPRRQ